MQTDVPHLLAALPSTGIDRATRLGLSLAPEMEIDAWRHLVARVAGLARTATGARQTLTAWLGDALAYGGTRGRGLISECAEAAGFDAGTLRNAKSVQPSSLRTCKRSHLRICLCAPRLCWLIRLVNERDSMLAYVALLR